MHKSLFYRPLCCCRRSIPIARLVLIWLAVTFFNLLPTTSVWAQPDEENSAEAEGHTRRSAVDGTHEEISRRIQLSADWLDKFFDDERYVDELNRTRLNVELSSFIEDGEGLDNSMNVSFRLALPRLNKRLEKMKTYLVISADPDDNDDIDNTPQDDLNLDFHDADDENANIGLLFVLKDSMTQNFRIKAGVKLGSGTQFYVGPRYRKLFRFEKWALRLTERIRYYTDDGFESKNRIDFERPITKRLFFRSSTDGSWYEEKTGFYYNLRLFLFHVISPIRVMEYEWRASYETRPHHQLQEVVFKIRYRQQFLKKWLFLDLVPMATFPREKDFDFTPGFMVQLEFIFGNVGKRLRRLRG